ncbi:2-dehydro-3-deoxy-D-gluconate 5-dehydrogenase [Peptococcaceae bacterium CEB3]|nr:2-dehydro-3-deoxy-D-gluconate 5-dehydrogenase [Peptococcaceae bacterium CEB3]
MSNVIDTFRLVGKMALITGGGRGIGKAISVALAEAGATIIIMDKDEVSARNAIYEIQGNGGSAFFLKGDVTSNKDVIEVVKQVVKQLGRIDVLVNDAGIVRNVKAEEMSWSDWFDVINVNLNGLFLMCQQVGRQMIKQKNGSIINISSMSANIVNWPQPQCSYNAAKAAVSHLTKSLAMEWAMHNIRVNAIAPGYISTELTKYGLTTEWGKTWIDLTPQKRVGTPEELGGLAVYLASEASSYVTGSIIVIDGGYSIV